MTVGTTIASPLGDLRLVGEETGDGFALSSLSMPGRRHAPAAGRQHPARFGEVIRQLEAWRHRPSPHCRA